MGVLLSVLEWIALALGAVIAGTAVAFLLVRTRIRRHVEEELGQNAVLMATTARAGICGEDSKAVSGPSVWGVLMLVANGLYFHSWIGSQEVFIPGPSISWIGISEVRSRFLGDAHCIVVHFLNAAGKEDGIFIRLIYPDQWVAAIKAHLITHAQ